MDEIVHIEKLSFSIDDFEIIKEASLKVAEGKMVGIIGPNGSGKTTLLKHVYRALPAGKGKIFLRGKDISDYAYRETAKLLTVMKQENTSDFDFKVMDMVLLGRTPYRSYFEDFKADDKQKAEQALKYVGMENAADKSFKKLSGGEKQRVLMARSITQEADIFVLDEPTNHLDVHYQWATIAMIKDMGKTVLGVFHELNLAAAYCDYIYVLNEGMIVGQGTPAEVITENMMRDVFRVEAKVEMSQRGTPHIAIYGAL